VPQRYDDTWHQLEAADERAWLDQWARAHLQTPQDSERFTAVNQQPLPLEPVGA
jgi:trehalose/maltose hydrolase-like predicted phosphorylase